MSTSVSSADSFTRSAGKQLLTFAVSSIGGVVILMYALSWASSLTGATATASVAVDPQTKTVTLFLSQEPPQLNSSLATDQVSGMILGHVMEGLLRYDKDNRLAPGMAERWEMTAAGATFWLRHDARWSDGVPVTAHDFVFSWRLAVDPANASEYAFIVYPVKNGQAINEGGKPLSELGVRALDDHTLEVVFEGELVASRSFTVGTAMVPELTVGGLRFEGAIRLANGEIELSPILSTNMRSLILFFDYTNATRTSSFEAIWSRDGLQLSRFGPAPWDGGAEGTWLLALDNERGFPPGSYQVDLIFDSETRGSAITTIGLDHDFGDNELIAPGDELSGELGEGEVAAFRVVDLIAGRPLRVAISGAGDADLYVKRGEQVSPDEFGLGWDEAGLQAPFLDGSDESVLIGDVGPGEEWFVALVGFDEGSTFTLTVEQRVGAESSAPPLVEFARQSGVLDQANPNDEYLVDVPAGTSLLTLVMTGTGDVDLYARPSQAVAAGQIGARADRDSVTSSLKHRTAVLISISQKNESIPNKFR